MSAILSNPWAILLVAAMLEIVWAISLKTSEGFTRLGPTLLTIGAAALSFWLLALAMKQLPVGTAYAVWTGIGAMGTALLGMALFGDPATWPRFLGVAMIVAGILALRLG